MPTVDFAQLVMLVSLLAAVSVASERLVEIIKGLVPWLNNDKTTTKPKQEPYRKAALQALAVVAGILTTWLAWSSAVSGIFQNLTIDNEVLAVIGIGFLASGGSGLWNAVLTYLLQVKNARKEQAIIAARRAEIASVAAARIREAAADELHKLVTELNKVDREFAAFMRN